MSFLIDTNILIYRLKNVGHVNENFIRNQDSTMLISVVSYGELVFGAEKSSNREKNMKTVEAIKSIFPMLDVDSKIMSCFGRIKATLQKTGKNVDDMDLLIAATAMVNNLTLVTHNTKHFENIPGLSFTDWY